MPMGWVSITCGTASLTLNSTHTFFVIFVTLLFHFSQSSCFQAKQSRRSFNFNSFVPYEHANSLNKLKLLCVVCLFYMEQYQLTFSVMNSHTKGCIYLFFNVASF